MQTHLIAVGNSKGLRLPKTILAQCGIEDTVRLKVTDEGLLISPVHSPRQGWEEAIKTASCPQVREDATGFMELSNTFDAEEWTWPDQNT